MGEWPSEQASHAAKDLENAWAKFNSSWKSDEDLADLADSLRSVIPAAQSAGLEGEVHNCIHPFIEEIARTHLEHEKCRALAEGLTELSMAVNNKWANSAINTLIFSTYFPRADYEGALPWLEKSVAMDNGSESENSLNNLAICYSMLGKTQLATAIFLRAVAVGKSGYLPEALFYLVHILAKCNSTPWSQGALTWVAQGPDSQYAAKAMSCLQGNCSSLYKFAFGSKSHKLLSASSENFSEVLVQIHQDHWGRWNPEIPLSEDGERLDDFASPASALGRVQKVGGLEPQLLEFCAQVGRGRWQLHLSILALTLEGNFEPSFSTFGAELLALWNRGETLLILDGLAQDAFLGQPEFDPKKHPGVNFAIHETLIRTLRKNRGYVSYAEDLVGWEVSLDSALESNYFDALVEQRQEGNLENFTKLLRESSSDPSMSIPEVARGVGATALLLLDILESWSKLEERRVGPGSFGPDFSTLLLDLVHSSPDPGDEEAAIQGLHEFLNIRLSFIRGELSENDEIKFSIQDSDFLARCLLLLAANDTSTVLDDCLLVLENSLVSPSLLPKVKEIAHIAWLSGAKYDPSDARLSKFPELVSLMLGSKSPSEVFSLSKNPAIERLVQDEDSLPLRLSRGAASKEETLNFVMSGRGHHVRELAALRGLDHEVYVGLFHRFGREIVHMLTINPDSYEALESEVGDLISSDRELGYACAKSFSETVEADWPRAMMKRLLETENRKALLLLAQDQRMSDNQLQKIASKANKEIAEALNQNPKASDETRALAQLVA